MQTTIPVVKGLAYTIFESNVLTKTYEYMKTCSRNIFFTFSRQQAELPHPKM
jgi:hypothetical protein